MSRHCLINCNFEQLCKLKLATQCYWYQGTWVKYKNWQLRIKNADIGRKERLPNTSWVLNQKQKIKTRLRKVGTMWTPYSTMQWFRLRRAGGISQNKFKSQKRYFINTNGGIFWHEVSFARWKDEWRWRFILNVKKPK